MVQGFEWHDAATVVVVEGFGGRTAKLGFVARSDARKIRSLAVRVALAFHPHSWGWPSSKNHCLKLYSCGLCGLCGFCLLGVVVTILMDMTM